MNGYPEVSAMSIAAIRRLNNAGIRCTTLTKGILPMELAQLSPENEHGITLISLDERYREKMEPGASPYADRLAALRALHDAGCRTWVSIEPYPTPNLIEQDLQNILDAVNFVDKIIFEARIQMASSMINPANVARVGEFGRSGEYIFFVMLGSSSPQRVKLSREW